MYTHAIEMTSDGKIWNPIRLADTPDACAEQPENYGREVLRQWMADEHDGEMPIDGYGNPLLRVVVYQVCDGDETPVTTVDSV